MRVDVSQVLSQGGAKVKQGANALDSSGKGPGEGESGASGNAEEDLSVVKQNLMRGFTDKSLAPFAQKLAELKMVVNEDHARTMRDLMAQNPKLSMDEAAFLASNKITGNAAMMKAALELASGGDKTSVMISEMLETLKENNAEETQNIKLSPDVIKSGDAENTVIKSNNAGSVENRVVASQGQHPGVSVRAPLAELLAAVVKSVSIMEDQSGVVAKMPENVVNQGQTAPNDSPQQIISQSDNNMQTNEQNFNENTQNMQESQGNQPASAHIPGAAPETTPAAVPAGTPEIAVQAPGATPAAVPAGTPEVAVQAPETTPAAVPAGVPEIVTQPSGAIPAGPDITAPLPEINITVPEYPSNTPGVDIAMPDTGAATPEFQTPVNMPGINIQNIETAASNPVLSGQAVEPATNQGVLLTGFENITSTTGTLFPGSESGMQYQGLSNPVTDFIVNNGVPLSGAENASQAAILPGVPLPLPGAETVMPGAGIPQSVPEGVPQAGAEGNTINTGIPLQNIPGQAEQIQGMQQLQQEPMIRENPATLSGTVSQAQNQTPGAILPETQAAGIQTQATRADINPVLSADAVIGDITRTVQNVTAEIARDIPAQTSPPGANSQNADPIGQNTVANTAEAEKNTAEQFQAAKSVTSTVAQLLSEIPEFKGTPQAALDRFSNMLLRIAKDTETGGNTANDVDKLAVQLEKMFTKINRNDERAGMRLREAREELFARLTLVQEEIARASQPVRTQLLNQTQKLMDHVRLLNTIDQFTYLQLPVQLGDDRKTAELYVFKRKGGKRADPDNVNILLSIDLEFMGHWEALLNIKGKDVYLNMEVAGEAEKEHFNANTVLLHELLSEAGFKLMNTNIKISKEETTPLTALSALERHRSGRQGKIDFTI